jgi:hypothetical protein
VGVNIKGARRTHLQLLLGGDAGGRDSMGRAGSKDIGCTGAARQSADLLEHFQEKSMPSPTGPAKGRPTGLIKAR